jgi:hypothetical protein
LSPENDLELNLSRIQIPTQLASGSSQQMATIQVAQEKVTDTRVVELGFHPTLSRAANFDDRADDDGLYLVLQPKNESGQTVAVPADLLVVVLDPARERGADEIGRWSYSATDVQSKLEPIGSAQGVHLRLPWNGPDPKADRVLVLARYTFENGRQVVGEKEFFVSSDGSFKTVWAPRSGSQRHNSTETHSQPSVSRSPVVQASHSENNASSNVVRPAPSDSPSIPAPKPELGGPFRW